MTAVCPNIRPARALDAAEPGWHQNHPAYDLVVIINLLHLIASSYADTVLSEIAQVLRPGGKLLLYGPFMRSGALTSEGDIGFDAALRRSDPQIGYKDDRWVIARLGSCGLANVITAEMPANNLVFMARRPERTL